MEDNKKIHLPKIALRIFNIDPGQGRVTVICLLFLFCHGCVGAVPRALGLNRMITTLCLGQLPTHTIYGPRFCDHNVRAGVLIAVPV